MRKWESVFTECQLTARHIWVLSNSGVWVHRALLLLLGVRHSDRGIVQCCAHGQFHDWNLKQNTPKYKVQGKPWP